MRVLILLMLSTLGQPSGAHAPPPAHPVAQPRPGLLIGGIIFEPSDIVSAAQTFDSTDASPNVTITFSASGRAKLRQAQEGRLDEPLEISVDREVVSSPILREIITGDRVTISGGGFTIETAAALARRIAPPR